jgi:hypothetical protein
MQMGVSVQAALDRSVSEEKTEFSLRVLLWRERLLSRDKGARAPAQTHYQHAFFEIVQSGLAGHPIFELLCELEKEMEQEFDRQWKLYLERLPLLLSLPLLLCFFPAYVILMFGPLVTQFLSEVSG